MTLISLSKSLPGRTSILTRGLSRKAKARSAGRCGSQSVARSPGLSGDCSDVGGSGGSDQTSRVELSMSVDEEQANTERGMATQTGLGTDLAAWFLIDCL